MRISTTNLSTEYGRFTKDSSTDNINAGKTRIQYHYTRLLSMANNYVVERTKYGTTKDGQRSYLVTPDYIKMKTIRVQVGGIWYKLEEIPSLDKWHSYTSQAIEGSIPERWIMINEQGNIHFELDPIPNVDGTTGNLEIIYEGFQDPITWPSITSSGTIAATKGSQTVTGSGTTFVSAFIGFFIQPALGKHWYEIKSVESTTSLTLVNNFQETTISGTSYTIAELLRLPAEFDYTPVYGAAADYWRPGNAAKAREFQALYDRDVEMLINKYQSKTKGRVTKGIRVSQNMPGVPTNYPKSALTTY